MTGFQIVPLREQLAKIGITGVPTVFLDAGEKATWRFIEFFTANIRNRNTREAYARAVVRFCTWCEKRRLPLGEVRPFYIAAYIEDLGTALSRPTVKQHLAAIRMLFDFLVNGQIVPMNPASSVRGPRYVVKKGKTPVLTAGEARTLLDSIEGNNVEELRDRALIAIMVFSFARVGAVVGLNVEDYFPQGRRMWFRLHEKGGKLHDVPAHHKAEEIVDAYLVAAGIGAMKGTPLFRTVDGNRHLTEERLERRQALAAIKRAARNAGLPTSTCCHSFRATGITTYLQNGGNLENAQLIANHASATTTKLYDRRNDDISLDEIEKILI